MNTYAQQGYFLVRLRLCLSRNYSCRLEPATIHLTEVQTSAKQGITKRRRNATEVV